MEASPTATPGGPDIGSATHRPVLPHELIQALHPSSGEAVIDGTFGGGGMTRLLLDAVGPTGWLLAIDRDPDAIERGRPLFTGTPVHLVAGSFGELDVLARNAGRPEVDIVLLDLGYSSLQIDDARRGFSFQKDGPLDMRYDRTTGTTASELLRRAPENELREIIRVYGEEPWAAAIAKSIVAVRSGTPLTRTSELSRLVEKTIPRPAWPARIHPATKTFQALRIAVNGELFEIEKGLQAALRVLRPGGRLGVISFHSLEDTLVKNFLHVSATNCLCPPQQPFCTCAHRATLFLPRRKPITASAEEIADNPRSRSARLRFAVKR